MTKGLLSWSGGKESALALYVVKEHGTMSIDNLFAFYSEHHQRVSYHGVRVELVKQQAESLGLSIDLVSIPQDCSSDEYFNIFSNYLERYKKQGIENVLFGDTYVVRESNLREDTVSEVGMRSYYPLEGKDTKNLIHEFVESGFKATTICVDAETLGWAFLGRVLDTEFIGELPDIVDPCGENGAYHTFVWDGPIFSYPLDIRKGKNKIEEVDDSVLYYCDILRNDQ